jgi:alkyl hydroperoxide reductase subunit F
MTIEEILAKVDTGATARAAEKLDAKGRLRGARGRRRPGRRGGGNLRRAQGHPHRRGGRALRRPGAGHLGIENFISVQHTEGPKLVMALEQHVKEYEVDIMNLQRAAALIPGDGCHQVQLANGATLKAKA